MLSINERKTTNEQMRSNCNVRSERHRFALLLSAVGGRLCLGWEAVANIYAHTHRSHGSWPSFSKNRIITGTRSKTLLIRLGMIEGRSQNASSHSFWTTRVFKGISKTCTVRRVFFQTNICGHCYCFLAEMGRIPCCGRPESSGSNI